MLFEHSTVHTRRQQLSCRRRRSSGAAVVIAEEDKDEEDLATPATIPLEDLHPSTTGLSADLGGSMMRSPVHVPLGRVAPDWRPVQTTRIRSPLSSVLLLMSETATWVNASPHRSFGPPVTALQRRDASAPAPAAVPAPNDRSLQNGRIAYGAVALVSLAIMGFCTCELRIPSNGRTSWCRGSVGAGADRDASAFPQFNG